MNGDVNFMPCFTKSLFTDYLLGSKKLGDSSDIWQCLVVQKLHYFTLSSSATSVLSTIVLWDNYIVTSTTIEIQQLHTAFIHFKHMSYVIGFEQFAGTSIKHNVKIFTSAMSS